MAEQAIVAGYTWTGGRVVLKVRDAVHEMQARPLEGRVCFEVLAGRHCLGFYDGEQARPCPDRAAAVRGASCDRCAARDAFRPCMTCDGFRCPRLAPGVRSWCRSEHHLYLACFGDQTIKVGTASHPRREQRIVEQGPLAAARVARADGPTIKQMEHLLAAEGFTETMRRSRKTALLRGAMSEPEARALVLDAALQLRQVLPARYHEHLVPPEPVEQPELAVRSRGFEVHTLPVQEGRVIEGEVVGAVGHVLFLADGDGRFALDLGELKGRRIVFDPEGPRRRPTVQLGLF